MCVMKLISDDVRLEGSQYTCPTQTKHLGTELKQEKIQLTAVRSALNSAWDKLASSQAWRRYNESVCDLFGTPVS